MNVRTALRLWPPGQADLEAEGLRVNVQVPQSYVASLDLFEGAGGEFHERFDGQSLRGEEGDAATERKRTASEVEIADRLTVQSAVIDIDSARAESGFQKRHPAVQRICEVVTQPEVDVRHAPVAAEIGGGCVEHDPIDFEVTGKVAVEAIAQAHAETTSAGRLLFAEIT